MTPKSHTVSVKLEDLPEVKARLEEAAATIERLQRECDEWEERYDELLAAVGGVWPG